MAYNKQITLEWSRSQVFHNSKGCTHPSEIEYLIRSFTSTYPFAYKLHPKYKNPYFNERTLARRRTYEVIELIRDTLFHRTVQYGEDIYTF